MKNLFTVFLFTAVLTVIFSSQNLFSQKESVNLKELSKDDIEKIQSIMEEYNKKIEEAMKQDSKIYKLMNDAIEKIGKLTKDSEKVKAIKAYQSQFRSAYNSALKKAGIDLNSIAKTYQSMFPSYKVSVKDNALHFANSSKKGIASSSSTSETGTTETVRLTDFKDSQLKSCGLASGGDVIHTRNSVEANSFGAAVGGCRNTGNKDLTYTVPKKVKSAVLKIKAKVEIDAYAVGFIISSGSNNDASIFVRAADATSYLSVSEFIVAPVLWVAHHKETDELIYERRLNAGDRVSINCKTFSASISFLCCATNGKAKVSNINATVTLVK